MSVSRCGGVEFNFILCSLSDFKVALSLWGINYWDMCSWVEMVDLSEGNHLRQKKELT